MDQGTRLAIFRGPSRDALFDCFRYAFPGNFVHRETFGFIDPSGKKFQMRAKVTMLDYDGELGNKFNIRLRLERDHAHPETSDWIQKLDGYSVGGHYEINPHNTFSGFIIYSGPRS